MYKQLKKDQGFTIIEVLIVLAIAGLILLIVFLAVPALQRSATNESRKTDAAAYLQGVSDYLANNNNNIPPGVSVGTDADTVTIGTAGTGANNEVKMGHYTGGAINGNNLNVAQIATAPATVTGGSGKDSLHLQFAATCTGGTYAGSATAPKYTPAAGTADEYVVVYETQSGPSTYAMQCIDS